tara:strand:+ start:240 stop:884 length:645 start_codon:yes stop_codon:yes gene_type:complete
MDEEISIIDKKTRNEKIKIFLEENKKLLISVTLVIILLILSFYSYKIYKDNRKELLSDKYNTAIIAYKTDDKKKTISSLVQIVEDNDSTYSPLALYFLIDNDLIEDRSEINRLFDELINETSFEKEIKNLIIYKKALYNADFINENELLSILKPIISKDSIWSSHAFYLIAEYFYSQNELQKSKEFFNQILNAKNANANIVKLAQKRLNRDLSD